MSKLTVTTYKCNNPDCKNTQVITDQDGVRPLPITCCVKCRLGFGVDLNTMLSTGSGMLPSHHEVINQDARNHDLM
jgi:hypothetical protein